MLLKINDLKFEILLGVCISILPWSLNLNSQLIIILILISLIDLIFIKKEIKQFSFAKGILIVIPFVMFLIGLIWTSNLKAGFEEIVSTISFIAIPFIFAYLNKYHVLNLKVIFKLFIISCLLKYFTFFISILEFDPEALFSILYWKTLLFRFNNIMNEQSIHPTYFSLFLGISIFLSFYLIVKSKKKISKYLWVLTALVSFFMIISIMAKMPILSLFISFGIISIVTLIKEYSRKKLIFYSMGLSIISFLSVYYIRNVPNTFVQDFSNYKNLLLGKEITDSYNYSDYGNQSELKSWKKTNRIFLWETGFQVWKKKFIIGTGTGDYKNDLNEQYLKNGYKYMAKASMNTHNQYLSYLVRYGTIGFLIISFCFILIFKTAYQNDSYIFIGIFMLCLLICITENILERQWGIVCFTFFTSLFLLNPKKLNR